MRIVSYRHGGFASFGVLTADGGIVDAVKRGMGNSLRDVLGPSAIETLRRLEKEQPDFALEQVEITHPVPNAGRIFGIGSNHPSRFPEHADLRAERPIIFLRTTQSVVGSGTPLQMPAHSEQLDYEGELGVVIGKAGRCVSAADAEEMIAGYCCFNDGTVRDHMKLSITMGKGTDATGACGPWLVTPDEVAGQDLQLETRVNGEIRQCASLSEMIFSPAEIIAFISGFAELLPGDIVVTGTPSGVGAQMNPQVWLRPGDEVEVEISGIGCLKNRVIENSSDQSNVAHNDHGDRADA